MSIIVCYPNMFSNVQTIHILNADKTSSRFAVPTNKLAEILVDNCNEFHIEHISLYGNTTFLEPMAEEILAYAKTKYNNINVKVEVINV